MPKSGIKIISDTPGTGAELKKGDRVRLRCDIRLSRGDYLVKDQENVYIVGDRNVVAGFRYGLEGMRAGGTRCFKASPHLCYGEGTPVIPANAVLIVDITLVELVTE